MSMNEQRKTVYKLRQQLLLGIYKPERMDEDGKPSLSLRGSVQVYSPTQLSIWMRSTSGV